MPAQYGEVIYQNRGAGPNQLYIIGISHRDPLNGSTADTTLKTQADIFRIGEWLSNTRNMQLLLPEGYFADTSGSLPPSPRLMSSRTALRSKATSFSLDNDLLHHKLADTSRFVNAEMLLMDNCNLPASQIEDRQIYDAVRKSLLRLARLDRKLGHTISDRLAELDYLQQTRTATLLQKIPSVIDQQIQNGTIHNRSAMFTIGLNHLQDIIRYLQNDVINIDTLAHQGQQGKQYQAELNLLKKGYGVTVIIPRTLANERQILQLTKLDHIFSISAQQPEIPSLN